MNPVISYKDFIEFMRWSPNNRSQLLPIVLMKPSTMLYLNREFSLTTCLIISIVDLVKMYSSFCLDMLIIQI